jgi:curved DNA-binding protein CbpA
MFLHKLQAEIFRDRHRFKVIVTGRRWGKTKLCLAEMLRAARIPRQKIWYVAPTYRMAKQIMWVELLEAIPKSYIVKSNETTLDIHLKNKTIISLRGADKPDTLRGMGINFIVLDEVQDIKPDAWRVALRPTLASTRGRGLFTGTPKAYSLLYDLYLRGKKDKEGNPWRSWQYPTLTSPFIPQSEIEAARADMDPRSFRQEFEASFEQMSGRVYHQFDRNIQVGNYPFNPKLPIWIGQDFNVDPMSTTIMQPQTNGEVWVVDELFIRSSNTLEICEEIEKRYWRYKKSITVYPDPAGANRQSGRGESDLDIFRERGFIRLKYRKKHPPVADRVNAVNKMFKSADGVIRLKINENCKHLIDSLEQTLYKPGTYEVNKTLNVEHMADSLGYAIEIEFPRRKFEPMGLSI